MTKDEVALRDARLTECVRQHKLTRQQILDFSQTWDRPFNNLKEVDRRITDLKLRNALRWKEDQGANERGAREAFIKIARDLSSAGYIVYDVQFEYSVQKAKIRCDCKFRARKRDAERPDYLFTLEYENAEKSDKWESVMRRYRDHRLKSEPFRVLVVFRHERVLVKVHAKAGEVMEETSPSPTLLVFASEADVLKSDRNAATSKVWATHRRKSGVASLVSLVPPL